MPNVFVDVDNIVQYLVSRLVTNLFRNQAYIFMRKWRSYFIKLHCYVATS